MLVMECVADWFFSDANRLSTVAVTERDINAELEDLSAGDRQQMDSDSFSAGLRQGNSGSPSAGGRQGDTRDSESLIAPTPKCHLNRCPRFFIFVVAILLLGVLLLIMGIFLLAVGDVKCRDAFMNYRIVYWVLMLLAAAIGYTIFFWFTSGSHNPSGFEYFMIFSSIGPILQCILSMVANTQTEDSLIPTRLFFAEEVFTLLQIVTQLLFYEKAKTTQMQQQGNEVCRIILKGVIVSFIVCNFALWAEDSFIETGNSMTSWQKYYFDKWPFVYNVFNPLALMFRFNSALLFLDVLFDNFYKQHPKQQ